MLIRNSSAALRSMPLKDMDPAMLACALKAEAKHVGIWSETLEDAISFASLLHAHQSRRNRQGFAKTHYIEHPLRVAIRLIRMGVRDHDTIVGAVLHDTVEDCGRVFIKLFTDEDSAIMSETDCRTALSDYISSEFGTVVATTVNAVSNPVVSQETENMLNSMTKDAATSHKRNTYFAHVVEAIKSNPRAYLVKLSDWLDNGAGLYHNLAGSTSEETIIRQAQKYLPLAPVFVNHADSVPSYLISTGTTDRIVNKVESGRENLERIVSL